MIEPTIGRVVLYRPTEEDRDEVRHAAIVTMVHSNVSVNLAVFDGVGVPYNRQTVKLTQEDAEETLPGGCEWMEYHKGQAANTSEISESLEETVIEFMHGVTNSMAAMAERIVALEDAGFADQAPEAEDDAKDLGEDEGEKTE